MEEKEFKNLLDKYLKNKASDKEIETLKEFEYNSYQKAGISDEDHSEHIGSKLYASIYKRLFKHNYEWLKIAASIVLIATVGLLGLWYGNSSEHTIKNTGDLARHIQLVDGTNIILNKGSQISYDQDTFNQKSRRINLQGEAFFKVSRDEERPFVVHSNDVVTRVLGTSFNIQENENTVRVTVTSGKVSIHKESFDKDIRLKAHEQLSIVGKKAKKSQVNPALYTTWWKKEVYLEHISLTDFIELLSVRFDIKVREPNLAEDQYYMSIRLFEGDKLEKVIKRFNYINELQILKTRANELEILKPE